MDPGVDQVTVELQNCSFKRLIQIKIFVLCLLPYNVLYQVIEPNPALFICDQVYMLHNAILHDAYNLVQWYLSAVILLQLGPVWVVNLNGPLQCRLSLVIITLRKHENDHKTYYLSELLLYYSELFTLYMHTTNIIRCLNNSNMISIIPCEI